MKLRQPHILQTVRPLFNTTRRINIEANTLRTTGQTRPTHNPYNVRQQQVGYVARLLCVGTRSHSVKVSALRKTPTGVIKFAQITALKFLIPGRNRAQGDSADLIVFSRRLIEALHNLVCPTAILPAEAKRGIVCSDISTYPLFFCARKIELSFKCCASILILNVTCSNVEVGCPNGCFPWFSLGPQANRLST